MSPELGFLLFVALLWGPTALWLVYRTLRGPRERLGDIFTMGSESTLGSELPPDEPATLLGLDGFWVCATCRSLNHPDVKRCYACRTKQDAPARPAAPPAPVTVGVPVMAKDAPARPAAPPAPVTVGVPVMAKDAPARPAAPPAAVLGTPVCPFLGFKNDPSTRYDFPDPTNVCHATWTGRGRAAAPRRLGAGIGGNGRTESIAIEHQRTHCLTAAHGQCARYPAAGGVAADR